MERFREAFIQTVLNDSDKLVLRAVPGKEFQHKKINNIDINVDYGAKKVILEDGYSLRQFEDLTSNLSS